MRVCEFDLFACEIILHTIHISTANPCFNVPKLFLFLQCLQPPHSAPLTNNELNLIEKLKIETKKSNQSNPIILSNHAMHEHLDLIASQVEMNVE